MTPPSVSIRDPSESVVISLGDLLRRSCRRASSRSTSTTSSFRAFSKSRASRTPTSAASNPGDRGRHRSDQARRPRLDAQRRDRHASKRQSARSRRHRRMRPTARRRSTCAATSRRPQLPIANLPVIVSGVRHRRTGCNTLAWRRRYVDGEQRGRAHRGRRDRRFRQRAAAPLRSGQRRAGALPLRFKKSSDASEVDSSNNVLRACRRSSGSSPSIKFKVINTQSRFTNSRSTCVMRTLLEGDRPDRHRDAVLPALVAQRDRRLHRDPDVARDRALRHEDARA